MNRRDFITLLGGAAACCDDDGRLTMDQIFRQRRQPVVATLRPAIFDRDSATLDPAEIAQPQHKSSNPLAHG